MHTSKGTALLDINAAGLAGNAGFKWQNWGSTIIVENCTDNKSAW
jgi:hypothetical protein